MALIFGIIISRKKIFKFNSNTFNIAPFLVFTCCLASVAFILSDYVQGTGSNRYLSFVPVFLIIIFSYVKLKYNSRKLLQGIILLAAFMNLGFSPHTIYAGNIKPNGLNRELIAVATANRFTKGYSDYWSGPINTYYGNNKIDYIQTRCVDSKIMANYWALETGALRKKVDETFYLYESDSVNSTECRLEDLYKQFGKPSREVVVSANIKYLVYNYDIKDKFLKMEPILYE